MKSIFKKLPPSVQQRKSTTERKSNLLKGKKMVANHVSDKELTSRIREELTTPQQKTNPMKKWAEDLNRHVSKEDVQTTNRDRKRCSTSVIIRETGIRTTRRSPSPLSEWLQWTTQETAGVDEDAEKGEPSSLLVGERAGAASLEDRRETPQEIKIKLL